MRGSDQFAWTGGHCKQSHHKCTSSIVKTVKPMYLHTNVLSSPYSNLDVMDLISFKSVDDIIPRHYVTWLTGNWQDGAANIWKEYKSCAVT